MASRVLNISTDGDSPTFPRSLCQGLIILTVEDGQPFAGLSPVPSMLGGPPLDLALQLFLIGAEQREELILGPLGHLFSPGHGILSSKSLKRPVSALLKSRVVILLLSFLLFSGS